MKDDRAKPPQGVLIAKGLRPSSYLHATLKPPQGYPKATSRLPQGLDVDIASFSRALVVMRIAGEKRA
jgi:hypothetical protein